ncbi:hypothetical protein V8E55_002336 [Tylopilus felleus]
MSDPIRNSKYCFTFLAAYIADVPEARVLACIHNNISYVTTATKKNNLSPIHHYLIGVIAGAIPCQCLTALSPHFREDDIARLEYTLKEFHNNKFSLTHSGACVGKGHVVERWEIPKLELLQSVATSIPLQGAPIQWIAEVTKCAHIHLMKKPAHSGNNQDSYSQMCCYLNHAEKSQHNNNNNNNNNNKTNPDPDHRHIGWKLPDYFVRTKALLNGLHPTAPHPYRTFAVEQTAFHSAVGMFSLANLPNMISYYLHCKSIGMGPTSWVRVQSMPLHIEGALEPPQALSAQPPSDMWPLGRYDSAIVSASGDCLWPYHGLQDRPTTNVNEILTYVQKFNIMRCHTSTGMHLLTRYVIPVTRICLHAHLIPHSGEKAHPLL